jgi:AcrR family transcriptional regulator
MEASPVTAQVDRREQLLEAAIRVINEQGMRGLTHRAVEAEAGVPHGSTTYYFGTRHDLTTALSQYIADTAIKQVQPMAQAMALRLADRSKPIDIDEIALGLLNWIDAHAHLELARYELQVNGSRDAELKQHMTDACSVFVQVCEPIVIACGSKHPAIDAKILQAAIDGWMFSRLTQVDQPDEILLRGVKLLLGAIGTNE